MNEKDRFENKIRFEKLMNSFDRTGKKELLEYLDMKTDFYDAPASTQFHLSCAGGLLQHSLNVYDCLIAKKENPIWKKILDDTPEESLIIMSLLHDLCKVNFYNKCIKNKKTYDTEIVKSKLPREIKHDSKGDYVWEVVEGYEILDTMPLGHGEKSVMLINCFMKLKTPEIFAIRWHMGFTEEKANYKALGDAMEKYPIVLALHEADLEASKLLEGTNDNK